MDQYRRPKPRSDIGRTRGQVAEFAVERIGNLVPQLSVEALQHAERIGDVKPRVQHLETKMILLVHHDAYPAREVHGSTRPDWLLVQARELLAHDVTLVQEKSVLRRQLIHP